jgi:hypothetical protein
MNRTGTILLAIFSLTASACSAGRVVAPAEARPVGVELTREDMAEIKTVAIRYYEDKKPDDWEVYVAELRRGAIFMKDELPGNEWPQIGIWKIEQDDGIALVRWSADSPAFYPMLTLAREEGRWIVTGDSYREELLSPKD